MCRQPPRPSPRTRGAAGPPPLLQRPRSGARGGCSLRCSGNRRSPPRAGARGTPRPEPCCGSRARRRQPPLVGPPGGPRAAAGQPWCTGAAGQCCCRHTRRLCTGEFRTAEPPPDGPRAGPAGLLLLAALVLPPSPTAGPHGAALCVLLTLALSGVSENREPASAPHPQSKLPVPCKAATDGHARS